MAKLEVRVLITPKTKLALQTIAFDIDPSRDFDKQVQEAEQKAYKMIQDMFLRKSGMDLVDIEIKESCFVNVPKEWFKNTDYE